MGSNRFYEDQLDDRGVHFALISDLVGHDVDLPLDLPGDLPAGVDLAGELRPLTFGTGAESHPDLPDILTGIAIPECMKLIATLNEYVGDMSDHSIFRRNGVPYLFLSCGHWEHYHQPTDTPDRLALLQHALADVAAAARATQIDLVEGVSLSAEVELEAPPE